MKLALYQNKNRGSLEANLKDSLSAIEKAAQEGADLILFPEVHLTEFFAQYPGRDASEYAKSMDSDLVKSFCEASRTHHIMSVPNIYLSENGRNYDTSLVIDKEGRIIGSQKMVHIAYADKFFETDYYTPSEEGFLVFDTEYGKIGIVVCFDRHYPESIRTEALMGADLILIPTANTLQEPMEMFEWEIKVQAFQNSAFIAMANRTGREDEMDFAGESIVVSPKGDTLMKADDREGLFYCEIGDPKAASELRREKPYTSLRRPECYK